MYDELGDGDRVSIVTVYLDQPILAGILGFIQDATLLWVVSRIQSLKTSWRSLWLGGAAGGLFQFFFVANQLSGGIVYSWILGPFIAMLLVPVTMIWLAFHRVRPIQFCRLFGYFYGISLLLACVHWGIDHLNRLFFHQEITLWWHFWIHMILILSLGELGWGIVHRQVWEKLCFYPLKITWDHHQIELNALLDTGNHLYDPLTRLPVVIIEQNSIKHLLPAKVIQLIEQLQEDDLKEINLPESWEGRVRLLPFSSIGKEHGLLVGFRPDEITVWEKNQGVVCKNVVVALHNRPLSPEGTFQALIPPAVLH